MDMVMAVAMEKDLVLHSSQWLATTSANILCYILKRKAHQIKTV